MIEHIQLLRNVGLFDNHSPPPHTALSPFTVIYGENARGKTTMAAVLRSLATGKADLVTDRHRLGAQHPPHIVIRHSGGTAVFQNGAWSQPLPDVAVFDDAFVSANVCSGIEVQTAHRQSLHELILGAQGVALSRALQGHVARIEEHNAALRQLADAVPAGAMGPFKVDAFCDLDADLDIDDKIQEAERRLAAAKSADAIRQRPGFRSIALPDFDIAGIDDVLGRTLADLEAAAADRVRAHIVKLRRGGEAWVSEGMAYIAPASEGYDGDVCPFCAQELAGSELIVHYRAYFSQTYQELKLAIRETGIGVRDNHGGDIPAAFERDVRTAAQTHEFWKDFAELPNVDIDTAAVARLWNAAREAVLDQLRAKAAAPLEPMALTRATRDAIENYRACIAEVAALSGRLLGANSRLAIVQEQAAADDLSALNNDLAKLKAQKARYEPQVAPHCDRYLQEKSAKRATEALRTQARADLDNYRQQIFPAFEAAINAYLRRFGASFRIDQVQSVNTRSGSSASYVMVINNHNVNITADVGPSFRSTLSAGDRNTLALAFFFASLEQDPNRANMVVVIDDPMTSLDDHRTLRTREEIISLAARVRQVIVLSHSKSFLCHLWEQADKNTAIALRINRAAAGSEITIWNVRNDSISEHDKRHELVRSYLQVANPEREREVAEALRPILEAFMRVAYPEHFPPGTPLGQFLNHCEQRVGTQNEILSTADIVELKLLVHFGNRFKHDSNPAWQTATINDAELSDFAERTLLFASRR
ncbi:AAA family ATPase [Salinarimonas chemoclinalis]|uniref:AAA family ATPase n=1 Tax=Salinarimonas chemoclinalis TaxID=3241599 RepID=UPI0035584FD8